MKKLLLFLVLVALCLAGCTKSKVVESYATSQNNQIGFSTYGVMSKGVPVNNTEGFKVAGKDFGVTAYLNGTTSAYMGTAAKGIQIQYNGTKWNYVQETDVRYWPTDGTSLNFYAYVPYTYLAETAPMTDLNITNSGMSFKYAVTNIEAKQEDLMFASATNVVKPAGGNMVNMLFKHALTQVLFAVRTTSENLYVDIKENGIDLVNINSTGLFTLPTNDENGWTGIATPITYTVTSAEVKGITYVASENNDFTQIGTGNNALMLIPQTFVGALPDASNPNNPTNGVYLNIKCKIYQKLEDETPVYLFGSQTEYAEYLIPMSSKNKNDEEIWNRGKRLKYNLIFGGGPDNIRIDFNPTVENWVDESAVEIVTE